MDNQNQPDQNQQSNSAAQNRSVGPRQQIVARLKTANNILVTVSNNPSVDQLSACIGLTLILNKMNKHATAVFSGNVPSTIEFLQPEKTIEKTTDSLRDFIIALDKTKADKLRYKVEDKVVKIFITPYRTSISEKDLEFSQGDLNVDAVVALGVHQQQDLDQAITAHGRILHDATIIAINDTTTQTSLGTINWVDISISSLSEMITDLAADLGGKELLDGQIATALLTGIVAVTNRFGNQKTSPQTMNASAQLLSAGANQQLVATKMEPPAPPPPPPAPIPMPPLPPSAPMPTPTPAAAPTPKALESSLPKPNLDGTINIDHGDDKPPEDDGLTEEERLEQIRIDNQGMLHTVDPNTDISMGQPQDGTTPPPTTQPPAGPGADAAMSLPAPTSEPHFMAQPPSALQSVTPPDTSESVGSEFDADSAGMTLPPVVQGTPMLSHDEGVHVDSESAPTQSPVAETAQPTNDQPSNADNETLAQIEEDVHSPHLDGTDGPSLDDMLKEATAEAQPLSNNSAAFNAEPLGDPIAHNNDLSPIGGTPAPGQTLDMPQPPLPSNNDQGAPVSQDDPSAPPPLPPPMLPPQNL